MPVLSNQFELVLLVVVGLKEDAYGMTIRRALSRETGRDWSIGAVYDLLYRMEKQGYLTSALSDPTPERGGRKKRIFQLTETGREILSRHRDLRDRLWRKIGEQQ